MFEGTFDSLHRELETLEEKVAKGPMNHQDLEHIDMICHALKCLKAYESMTESGETYPVRRRYEYRRY